MQFVLVHGGQFFGRTQRRISAWASLPACGGQDLHTHAAAGKQGESPSGAEGLIVWVGKDGK